MREDWRLKHSRISFNQRDTWRHLKVEIDQLEARLRSRSERDDQWLAI